MSPENLDKEKGPFIVFCQPEITDEDKKAALDTLNRSWPGTGPVCAEFEKRFGEYNDSCFSIAVNSCTAALHLSLLASGIGPGDEVITTPMTFAATVNVIEHVGATPILADIDPVTMNIDPKQIEKVLSPNTKAIIPVHFAGRPCDMKQICGIVDEHDLVMIEDCAHAIGTEYDGKRAGNFGKFGCFSFYATKNITTGGEGGMVVTNDATMAERLKVLRLHGMSKDAWKRFGNDGYKHYLVEGFGWKYNLTDWAAAIGLSQLSRVESIDTRRSAIWSRYNSAFANLPITTPTAVEPGTKHAHHLYTILVDEIRAGVSRDRFLEEMTIRGIGVGVHYLSIPEHPVYRETYGWKPEDYPNAMRVGRQTVSLPIQPQLTDREIERVIKAVTEIVK